MAVREGRVRLAVNLQVNHIYLFYFVCAVCICVGMCVREGVWRSEDSLEELGLSYYMGMELRL